MTAVCFKAKNPVNINAWSSIFTDFNTDAQSCLFIKQLTSTCISTILHLRKVFSDDYFEAKSFEGMTLKFLKPIKGENDVSKIEQWLEGAFEAMENKYLKRLMLDIQDAQSNLTLEIYSMTFYYSKEKEDLNPFISSTTSNKDNGFAFSDTKSKTIKLLQMCHAVTQSYSSLPPQVKLSMRLSYYENTPEDYQPSGYMAWESEEHKFPKQARSIEIGITGTQHHVFKFFNKSCLNENFFKLQNMKEESKKTDSNEAEIPRPTGHTKESKQLENIIQQRLTRAKRELRFDNSNKSTKMSLLVSSKIRAQTEPTKKNESKLEKNPAEEHKLLDSKITTNLGARTNKNNKPLNKVITGKNFGVRCACLSYDVSDKMFPCLSCKFMVHSECFGILQFDSSKKIRFYCNLCHQAENNFKCHDKVIMSLKNSSDQQKLALLRRVLRHCTMPNVNKITLKKMEKIAGTTCPKNVVNVVLSKMIEIGIAIPQKKRKSYLLDKNKLANELVHYFYKIKSSNHNQSQFLPNSLTTSENFNGKNDYQGNCFNKKSKQPATILQDFVPCNSQISQQSCDIFC